MCGLDNLSLDDSEKSTGVEIGPIACNPS